MNTAVVVTKIDPQTKKAAMKIADELGIPLSVVIKAFLKQFIRTKSISLSIDNEVPNKYMTEMVKKSEEEYAAGKAISFDKPQDAISYVDKLARNATKLTN